MNEASGQGALCGPADIPRMVAVRDVRGINLSAEEGFLLSRIDGKTAVSGLVQLSVVDEARTIDLLATLYQKGLINFERVDAREARVVEVDPSAKHASHKVERQVASSAPPSAPTATPAGSEAEKIEALRKRVMFAHSAFQVLGIEDNAPPAVAKKAYRTLAKEFHPDRFFRKDIDRDLVAGLFQELQKAMSAITEGKPQSYLPNPALGAANAAGARASTAAAPVEATERQEDWVQRAREEVAERVEKAKKRFREGQRLFDVGDYEAAVEHVQAALTLDPWNAEYPKLHARVGPLAAKSRGVSAFNRGHECERAGRTVEAAEYYEQATVALPEYADAYLAAGRLWLANPATYHQARVFLQKAAARLPKDVRILEMLAQVYRSLEMYNNALRTLEQVLRLVPGSVSANQEIRALQDLMRQTE